MTLELKDQNGRVRDKAISFLRPRVLGHFSSVRDRQQLLAHAQAIAAGRYDQAEEDSILALFRLVENTERPALMAPLAEPFVRRFGKRRSKVMDSMKYALATYIASNDPHRAADLFADLARSAEDSWQGACAAAEYLDLLFFRISETQDPVRFITPLLGGRTRREVALLKARRGDLHRVAGDAERALKAYRDAQRVAYRELDRRQAAVLQSAYRETALSYLQQERYPALRDLLFQWEADFPAGKQGGDLPLLTGRYYQAVGDPKRARIEYETILKLNPLHSRAPEITFRLAQSLDDLGEKDEARAKFATVVRQYPNSPFARNARYEVHP
jgi:tetratricopeptide (TPR) repeat protein